MANRADRNAAIDAFLTNYVDEIGEFLPDVTTNVLEAYTDAVLAIEMMRRLGTTARWKNAIDKWQTCFSEQVRPMGKLLESANHRDSFSDRQLYIRTFKWAVMQGAIYAGYGA